MPHASLRFDTTCTAMVVTAAASADEGPGAASAARRIAVSSARDTSAMSSEIRSAWTGNSDTRAGRDTGARGDRRDLDRGPFHLPQRHRERRKGSHCGVPQDVSRPDEFACKPLTAFVSRKEVNISSKGKTSDSARADSNSQCSIKLVKNPAKRADFHLIRGRRFQLYPVNHHCTGQRRHRHSGDDCDELVAPD